jgi:hypothetical protein
MSATQNTDDLPQETEGSIEARKVWLRYFNQAYTTLMGRLAIATLVGVIGMVFMIIVWEANSFTKVAACMLSMWAGYLAATGYVVRQVKMAKAKFAKDHPDLYEEVFGPLGDKPI